MFIHNLNGQVPAASSVQTWPCAASGFVARARGTVPFPTITGNRLAYGRRGVEAYNEWAIRTVGDNRRVRPVLPLNMYDSVEEMMATTRRLIDRGIRAIWISGTQLPAGKSPARTHLDPFWDLLVASDTTVCLHIGGEGRFLHSYEWGDAPSFKGYMDSGVFERHPGLQMGVIELGAYWVGPMMETLDMWYNFITAKFKNIDRYKGRIGDRRRMPRLARPRRRAIFVDAPVSSMNTNRSGSRSG